MWRELFTRAVARVVYSRTFPSLTKPRTGRLNKSPHTAHAISNRSKSGPLPRILAGDRIDQVKAARVLRARLVIALHRVVEGPLRVQKFDQTRLTHPVR